MPTVRTVTLGCKVNQYETEYVRQGLLTAGYADAPTDAAADICIVNTCTVTHEGDAKSRQTIRRLAKDNPQSRIVVMGCYATRAPAEVASLPNVAEVVTDKRELPDLLGRFGVVDVPDGISDFAGRHRAFIKVQDGCLLRCSFCIIPHVRPTLASRPADSIVAEARRLLAAGFRELVLTGIHLGHYGVDFSRTRAKTDWMRLPYLLRRLMEIREHPLGGPFRIRLSSIEATEVTRELLEVMAEYADRICPHLHVSMQSGSDGVLRRMHRRWGAQRFVDRCRLAQATLDLPALTTDVIVGFPGEADAEFDETCAVVRDLEFSKLHIFPFSARRGTPAATMANQIAPQLKAARCEQLKQIETATQQAYYRRLAGKRLDVLVQSPVRGRAGRMWGTACRYASVELAGELDLDSKLVPVVAGAFANGYLQGASVGESLCN